jgi:hypothetical protein
MAGNYFETCRTTYDLQKGIFVDKLWLNQDPSDVKISSEDGFCSSGKAIIKWILKRKEATSLAMEMGSFGL